MKNKETNAWLKSLRREALIRSGVILSGNTRDRFWSGEGAEYASLVTLVLAQLEESFDILAVWDPTDGLRFPIAEHEDLWDRRAQMARAAAGGGEIMDLGDDDAVPAPAGVPSDGFAIPPSGRGAELDQVLADYRLIKRDGESRPLLVIDWSEYGVSDPARLDANERREFRLGSKAFAEEPTSRLDSEVFRSAPGTLIWITSNFGAIPPVFYQGETRVTHLPVPLPSRTDRRAFFERHLDDLRARVDGRAAGQHPGHARMALVEAMADGTEHCTMTDLRQIIALSQQEAAADCVMDCRELLNLYRLGDNESPWKDISRETVAGAVHSLSRRVLGQDRAVAHVVTMIKRAVLGLDGLQHSARRQKPKASLFFVGPTGVGKTELAKSLAELLFGDEGACIRFDMSEYNHEHGDQRLVGAPPGYVGFENGGQLTNAVRERPFSVLLFDEIEKAHDRVLDKFLQILEDGRLTDGRGETSWFGESVIIFTSNLGASAVPEKFDSSDSCRRHFERAVEDHFVKELGRPELLNRLGENIVVFDPIDDDDARRRILSKKLEPIHQHVEEAWDASLEVSEEVHAWLLESARKEHGGRGLLNAIEQHLVNPMADFIFEVEHQLSAETVVQVSKRANGVCFEVRRASQSS